MIKLNEIEDCCGCSACEQICPKSCITMSADEEGFLYPRVDNKLCVECNLCISVCPELKQYDKKIPIKTYAAINKNELIVAQSSSGGFFTALATDVLLDEGVVFGARFSEDFTKVVHDYTENVADLILFRGSKYVQSDINSTYIKVRKLLKEKRKVLFTGTPCQIAGLKSFLRKDYNNLITCDFICHGVPSPLVWSKYISTFDTISNVSFRDKTYGWKNFSMAIDYNKGHLIETLKENIYLKGFLKDIYLRPACYQCHFKAGKANSDITMGDYWGIENVLPEIDKDLGVSAVTANSELGMKYVEKLNLELFPLSYAEVYRYNPALEHSVKRPKNRSSFFKRIEELDIKDHIEKSIKVSIFRKGLILIKRIIKFGLRKIGLYE